MYFKGGIDNAQLTCIACTIANSDTYLERLLIKQELTSTCLTFIWVFFTEKSVPHFNLMRKND